MTVGDIAYGEEGMKVPADHEVDPKHCYVSDLDLYDRIKSFFESGDVAQAEKLAPTYWEKLTSLEEYGGWFRHPEVLVTYNIPAEIYQRSDSVLFTCGDRFVGAVVNFFKEPGNVSI